MHAKQKFALALSLLVGGCAAQVPPIDIADVNATVSRLVNRVVTVQGQVVGVQADPVGTSRGQFVLRDETDQQGLRVITQDLPAPGGMYHVTGTIMQDPQNARLVILRESSRTATAGNPIFLILMIGSGVVALALIAALVFSLTRKRPPTEFAMHAPIAHTFTGDETVPFRANVVDDPTVQFEYWGFRTEVVEGPDQGRSIPVGVSPFFIGRSGGRANQLELADRTVSRSQCAIRRHPKTGEFTLEHQGGTNETHVDGKPVQSATLSDGSRIRMGSTIVKFSRDQA